MAKRRTLGFQRRVQIMEFLRTVCRLNSATGFAEYDHPWNDRTVAEKFNASPGNVAGIRKVAVGDLRPAPNVSVKQFEELSHKLTELSTAVRSLNERMAKLEAWAISKGGFHIKHNL